MPAPAVRDAGTSQEEMFLPCKRDVVRGNRYGRASTGPVPLCRCAAVRCTVRSYELFVKYLEAFCLRVHRRSLHNGQYSTGRGIVQGREQPCPVCAAVPAGTVDSGISLNRMKQIKKRRAAPGAALVFYSTAESFALAVVMGLPPAVRAVPSSLNW